MLSFLSAHYISAVFMLCYLQGLTIITYAQVTSDINAEVDSQNRVLDNMV